MQTILGIIILFSVCYIIIKIQFYISDRIGKSDSNIYFYNRKLIEYFTEQIPHLKIFKASDLDMIISFGDDYNKIEINQKTYGIIKIKFDRYRKNQIPTKFYWEFVDFLTKKDIYEKIILDTSVHRSTFVETSIIKNTRKKLLDGFYRMENKRGFDGKVDGGVIYIFEDNIHREVGKYQIEMIFKANNFLIKWYLRDYNGKKHFKNWEFKYSDDTAILIKDIKDYIINYIETIVKPANKKFRK